MNLLPTSQKQPTRKIPLSGIIFFNLFLLTTFAFLTSLYINNELEKTSRVSQQNITQAQVSEKNVRMLSQTIIPLAQNLSNLEQSVQIYLLEFELYTLDPDREPTGLIDAVSGIQEYTKYSIKDANDILSDHLII